MQRDMNTAVAGSKFLQMKTKKKKCRGETLATGGNNLYFLVEIWNKLLILIY